jgi:hypothetical protein
MELIHSYSSDKSISTTIFRSEFDFSFENIKLTVQLSDLKFFVDNGLDLKINFNEYFKNVQLIKSIFISETILFNLINRVFSNSDLDFNYDDYSKKLTHLKNSEDFVHSDIKSYFEIVKNNLNKYSEDYKKIYQPDNYKIEIVENNIIFKSNNFYFLIENKNKFFDSFEKYFEKYFENTEKYMTNYIEKNLPIAHKDIDELFTKGALILNDYANRDNLTYPDLENLLNYFLPNHWCSEENNTIF